MVFKASLDKMAMITTICISIIFIGLIVLPLLETGFGLIGMFFSSVGIVLYLVLLGLSPLYYRITEDALIIHRLFKDVIILKEDISRAHPIDSQEMLSITRMFGAAGIYGYYGIFANATLGKMTWYATRLDSPVLITSTEGKKFILTPDKQEQFLMALYNYELCSNHHCGT